MFFPSAGLNDFNFDDCLSRDACSDRFDALMCHFLDIYTLFWFQATAEHNLLVLDFTWSWILFALKNTFNCVLHMCNRCSCTDMIRFHSASRSSQDGTLCLHVFHSFVPCCHISLNKERWRENPSLHPQLPLPVCQWPQALIPYSLHLLCIILWERLELLQPLHLVLLDNLVCCFSTFLNLCPSHFTGKHYGFCPPFHCLDSFCYILFYAL